MRDEHDVPRHAFPLVLPKPFGFEEAVHRGRRIRRHRAAGAGAGMMTLVLGVLGAAVLAHGPGGAQSIGVTNDTGRPGEQSVPYSRAESRSEPSTAPSRPTDTTTHAAGSRDDTAGGPAVVFQHDQTPVGSGGTQRPPVVPRSNKPAMTGQANDQPNPCPPVLNPPERGWCTSVTTTSLGAGMTRLTFEVCRDASDTMPGGLVFRTAQEADFRVTDATSRTDRWQWSVGQRFGPHADQSITVQAGRCYEWWVDWDHTDESGRALPTGSYVLQGWSTADGLAGRAPAEYPFNI